MGDFVQCHRDRRRIGVMIGLGSDGFSFRIRSIIIGRCRADSKVERPEYVLKDFQKIRLDAGEEKEVKLVCPIREMAYFDEGRNEFVAEFLIPYEVYVGTSSLREELWVREV